MALSKEDVDKAKSLLEKYPDAKEFVQAAFPEVFASDDPKPGEYYTRGSEIFVMSSFTVGGTVLYALIEMTKGNAWIAPTKYPKDVFGGIIGEFKKSSVVFSAVNEGTVVKQPK